MQGTGFGSHVGSTLWQLASLLTHHLAELVASLAAAIGLALMVQVRVQTFAGSGLSGIPSVSSVSYTHLDVYKRQVGFRPAIRDQYDVVLLAHRRRSFLRVVQDLSLIHI